jgi:Lysyl oxidase
MSRAALAILLLTVAVEARAEDLPDLVLDTQTLSSSLAFDLLAFGPSSCVLQPSDLCVDGPGARKLMRFSVAAVNQGTADVELGSPIGNPQFVFSQCHNHYHFQSFARYELHPRGQSSIVTTGSKRAFCVEDTKPTPAAVPRPCTTDADCAGRGGCAGGTCRHNCNVQGIQVGWSDLYPANLDCQWLDVTEIPPGEYDLTVFLNTSQLIPESSYDNDVGTVPVTIEGPTTDHPAPKVKVRAPHAHQRRKLGRRLKVAWQVHIHGGNKNLRTQEVWLSRDGGATFELLTSPPLTVKARSFATTLSGAPSDAAMVRVVVWSTALQRGIGESASFNIVP